MDQLSLPSGLAISKPLDRLLRFCREEYPYYDGIKNQDPDMIEPLDILATVGINSRIDTALKVRTVHRGMSEACDPLLRAISRDADLLSFEPLDQVRDLFVAAMTSKYVLLSVASKVLHRKRPSLIPVLDGVVVAHYLRRLGQDRLLAESWESRTAAAEAGRLSLEGVREDLTGAKAALKALRQELAAAGFPISHVRVLDILLWTETERAGSYRV